MYYSTLKAVVFITYIVKVNQRFELASGIPSKLQYVVQILDYLCCGSICQSERVSGSMFVSIGGSVKHTKSVLLLSEFD